MTEHGDGTEAWRARFVDEMRRRGHDVLETLEDGRVVVAAHGAELVVKLDNLFRQLRRDGSDAVLRRFVDDVLGAGSPLPPWDEAAPRVRFIAARPPEEETDVIAVPVSDRLVGVLAHVGEDEQAVRWIGERQQAAWGVSDDELLLTASRNTGVLMDRVPLTVENRDGLKVVVLQTESPQRASLVFSPNLRAKLEPLVGWPALAVVPCRDFILFFAASDEERVARDAAAVVVREFRESAWPLTTEVLHLSDEGIVVAGWFGE